MRTKKLNQHQQRLVAAKQQRHLDETKKCPNGERGLVMAHFGKTVEILDEKTQTRIICQLRRHLPELAAGDWIIWEADPVNPIPVVVARQQRQSELNRPDRMGNVKTIAANITQLVIVIALIPEPIETLIDRYLIVAQAMSIKPIVVLNKIDLDSHQRIASLDSLLACYEKLGYDLCRISTQIPSTLTSLTPHFQDHTSIVVGQSGVGKSSLLKALLPDQSILINEVSHANLKGQHTTTNARYYHLPTGGAIIDSPGVREFSLQHLTLRDLINGFAELAPVAGKCRFRNCTHETENDCAIQFALAKMDPKRRQSFLRLKRDFIELKKR